MSPSVPGCPEERILFHQLQTIPFKSFKDISNYEGKRGLCCKFMWLTGSISTKRLNSASSDINQHQDFNQSQNSSTRVKTHQPESKHINQYQNNQCQDIYHGKQNCLQGQICH